ncbi:MAG: (d)CMP kinase [Bacteroidales bacterium]|nr:(d)CMP kinase [Bacteroidales bacterium]MBN2761794.1 (d)CMP kinase [Bacteroidales bacterium]
MSRKDFFIIAVDGYSSCGKSTFAKAIAGELNLLYIDSGAMYRAVALYSLENRIYEDGRIDAERLKNVLPSLTIEFHLNEKNGIRETFLNNRNIEDEIRTVRVSEIASTMSKIKEVRERMVSLQRMMSNSTGRTDGLNGVIMDGRDIGTVVFPHADMKIFMTADVDIRAKRRYDELVSKGLAADYDEVRKNVVLRDHQDETRKESPLRKASDALLLDNSHMSVDEQMKWFLERWRLIQLKYEGGN